MASLARLLSCTSLADPSIAADAAASASLAGCGAMLVAGPAVRQLLTVTVSAEDYRDVPSPRGCGELPGPCLMEPATLSCT
jgi:hypothetical protein